MTGWGAILGALLTAACGGGGLTALVLVRATRRKTNADTELLLQKAAAQAVSTFQKALAETQQDLERARKQVEQLEKRAELLQEQLLQANAELLQARRETEELRSQSSAERRQLLEQIAAERAAHEAAMAAVRRELSAAQLRRLANGGIGTVLGAEDFGG